MHFTQNKSVIYFLNTVKVMILFIPPPCPTVLFFVSCPNPILNQNWAWAPDSLVFKQPVVLFLILVSYLVQYLVFIIRILM